MRMSLITAPSPGPEPTTFLSRGQAFFANFFVTYYQKNACTSGAGYERMLASAGGLALGPD